MKSARETLLVRAWTLGCKVNQVDTAALLQGLAARGFEEAAAEDIPDLHIINACTVTAGADRDARKLIHRARRENAASLVVLTGCLSALGASGQEGADMVVGNEGKGALADRIAAHFDGRRIEAPCGPADFFGGGVNVPAGKARAFLKVQDGCDMVCSYCVIPSVRGRSRSRSLGEIVVEVEDLVRTGCREVVLTGVHLASFGRDRPGGGNLVGLLRAILDGTDLARLRLSSIEPLEISDELVRLMADEERLCRHLHVPMQSGDDQVLARMKRPYRRSQYLERVRAVAQAIPQVLIGADLIVGFPGESEEAFSNTLSLVEEAPVSHLHVFPYSERPGTSAGGTGEPVSAATRKERSARLRRLGAEKKAAFMRQFVGTSRKVLAIKRLGVDMGEGLTRNYLPVLMNGPFEIAKEYELLILGIEDGGKARLVAAPLDHE